MKKKNLYTKGLSLKPVLIAVFVVVAGIIALSLKSKEESDILILGDEIQEQEQEQQTGSAKDQDQDQENSQDKDQESVAGSETQQPKRILVYICGKVREPGLFECHEDTRIADVVGMAGGLLEEADETCVNMAARVTDGQQIIIYGKDEQAQTLTQQDGGAAVSASAPAASTGGSLININTADETALKTLPGIGEQKAKAIISYRQESGSFTRIEDIMKVSGIKDGAFSKIKDLITV